MIIEKNAPASSESLQKAGMELKLLLPAYLKAFYRQHDGFQCYAVAEDGHRSLKYVGLGVDAANIRITQLHNALDRSEYLELYQQHYGDLSPLAYTTREFHEWLYELDDRETSRLDMLGFPTGHICIAVDWLTHDTYWIKAGSDDARVYFAPTPRFSLVEDVERAYVHHRQTFPALLEAWGWEPQ